MNLTFTFEISNLKFRHCRLRGAAPAIFCLLLLLLACGRLHAAGMDIRIQTPDAALMMPPVGPPQFQKEGLPLSWEESTVKDLIGYLERGAYEEALAYLREKEGYTLELIEKGDPDGELKQRAVVGGFSPTTWFGKISAYMLYLIGHAYFSLENYKAAETAFLTALIPMPDYTRVHESLGLLYLRLNRYEDARKHLARAAGLGLHTAELYGALGYLHYQTGNFWGAASAFQKALMLKPDSEQWERGRLQALSRSYQHRDALTLVGGLLKRHPDDAGLWLFSAKAALQAGEKEMALAGLETAIRLGDDTAANRQLCALLHMEVGSIERAAALMMGGALDSMEFIGIDQGMNRLVQAEAWGPLEQMLVSVRGKWDGLDDLQRSRVLTREAEIDLHKGDKTAAGHALEKAILLDPSNADALISLADIYRGKGDRNRAELLYQRAGAYGAYREKAMVSLAQLSMDQDDFERALQILRDVLKAFPDRTDLGRTIESLGNLVLLRGPQP